MLPDRYVTSPAGLNAQAVQRNFDALGALVSLLGTRFFFGSGSPENVVTAEPGAVYLNASGGAGTSLYVKESGSADTGWVAK